MVAFGRTIIITGFYGLGFMFYHIYYNGKQRYILFPQLSGFNYGEREKYLLGEIPFWRISDKTAAALCISPDAQ